MSLAMSHEILASLGLESSDGLPDAPIMAVNTGNLMLIVPLNSASALRRIQPDFAAIERISEVSRRNQQRAWVQARWLVICTMY